MALYPEKNMTISKLDEDEKAKKSLQDIQTYLGVNGDSYSQTWSPSDRPTRSEYHYFMGDAVVRIMTFNKRADIKIIAATEKRLDDVKMNLEKLLK
jgi:hypothetical protein